MKCKKCSGCSFLSVYYTSGNGEESSPHMRCRNCQCVYKEEELESMFSKGIAGKDYFPYIKQIEELRSEIEALKKEVGEIKGYRMEKPVEPNQCVPEEHLNVGYGLVYKVARGLYELYGYSIMAIDSPYKLPKEIEDAYYGIIMGEAHRKDVMKELDKGKS